MNADVFIDTNIFLYSISDQTDVVRALEIQQRFQLSYWDAAIVAAAQELGCHTLFTEDLSNGQDYDGVTVVNPFGLAESVY